MELSLTSEQYTPAVNEEGHYVDRIPYIKKGLLCACNGYTFTYKNRAKFTSHTKTQKHKEWLVSLNANKAYHYADLERTGQLVAEQRLIIVRQSNRITQLELQVAAAGRKRLFQAAH